jgi:hypothetical protein
LRHQVTHISKLHHHCSMPWSLQLNTALRWWGYSSTSMKPLEFSFDSGSTQAFHITSFLNGKEIVSCCD